MRSSAYRGLLVFALVFGAAQLTYTQSASAQSLFERVAELRHHGHDLSAARLLEAENERAPSARLSAELGLAYQGAGRFVDAERHLALAMEARSDGWIGQHRDGLELALRYLRASLAWVVVQCSTQGAEVRVVGDGEPGRCGEPLRIGAGRRRVEVRAFGHRSVQETVDVGAGERAELRVALDAHECETPGMRHIAGDAGGCCWAGQAWSEGGCVGVPECPDGGWLHGTQCMSADAARPGLPRLASFHVGLLGGVTNFGRSDTSLFRPDVAAGNTATSMGPRVELRVGFQLFDLFGLDLTVGGNMQDVGTWLDCAPGEPSCAVRSATAYTLDFGLMFLAHTDPPRVGGNVDFHVGVGVRPWTNLFLDDGGDGSQVTATVVPAELGMSIFFADVISLDLIGQAELWVPWEYCGHGTSGTAYCVGSDMLDYELAWSGLAGLSVHVD